MKRHLILLILSACLANLARAQPYTAISNPRLTPLTPAQLTADANNYAPAGIGNAVILRLSTDAPRSITGIAAPAAAAGGRPYWLHNVGAHTITLPAESASSTAANRFAAATTLQAGELKLYLYDATLGRWVPYTDGGGGGGSVTSVFGRSGTVTAQSGDYTAAQVTFTPAGGIAATTVQLAIEELDAEKQPLNTHLTDLADGTLTGSKVGSGISGDNVTTGTIADARVDAAIARDAEVAAAYQPLNAHLTDLADGTLTGSKVGSGIDDDNVSFDDADNLWTASTIGAALEELNDSINAGVPNGAGAKVHWSQLLGVPAVFADGTDDGAGGGSGDVVGPASATDNALARWDTTTGKLLQNSVAILDDSGNMSGLNTLKIKGTASPGLEIVRDDGGSANYPVIQVSSYGVASAGGEYFSRSARGTESSPTQTLSGDRIGGWVGFGYPSSGAWPATGTVAIAMFASEDYTSGARGSYLTLATTLTGSTSRSERARISAAGNLLVGTTSDSGLTGAGGLRVGSTTASTSAGTGAAVIDGGLGVGSNIVAGGSIRTPYLRLLENQGAGAEYVELRHYSTSLTANRLLLLQTPDSDVTLQMTASAVLSGTNTGDQSLFGTIAVSGQSSVLADQTGDTLTLAAGSNITITTNATTDTVTIAASGSTGYGTIQEEGSGLTQRATLNFVGGGITAADDAGNTRTNVTLGANLNALEALASTGIAVRTGSDTWAQRTITGTANQMSVANGDGVSGNPTLSLPTDLQVPGAIALVADISPAQITADQNDYSPTGLSTAVVLRLSTDAPRSLTGLAGGADGRWLKVLNVGSSTLTLLEESTSSTAANRFLGGTITLAAGGATDLIYDATSSRWRIGRSFAIDASSLTLNASGQLQRAALSGVITASAGSNTTSFADATITGLAALSPGADTLIYATGTDSFATTALTSTARSLLDDASTAAMLTTLGAQAADGDLAAAAGLSANGIVARTATDTWTVRTITGTANQVSVSNGDGVSGNPTLSLPQDIATTSRPTFSDVQLAHSTLTYSATTDIDLTADGFRTVSLTGNVTFTTSNRAAGRSKTIRIVCDGTQRTFTFPVGWKFFGAAAPANIAASKTAILTITCLGTADSDVIAAYSAEP